ncbi:TIGR00180 family glycosyltransferase [Ferruginibacter paludis]|uniref:TIGR00180 family glycosyltransferase n=1 Tax=Ferruginibacter paludis TaxID=1310417 RepID=UPI0025B3FB16|nr:TIGR00180 family glycosyltransferase [Ferruginibacter paludis]MDN3657161.1 TIGR00180 family glycosyltransferase [Ferruginibacter paludis]
MNTDISIIIPTHNRHGYLTRILEYYSLTDISLFVADSTAKPYDINLASGKLDRVHYFHLPQKSLTGKIAFILEKVRSPYVVMCADDDFIIPEALLKCISFLKDNEAFSSAMGNTICYKKVPGACEKIDFLAMYTDRLSYRSQEEDPFKRLQQFFHSYRTIFCAVHRTDILKQAFRDAEQWIRNLFLNEYITAIYPLVKGHIIELPFLYQVREYTEYSDDKTTPNIDTVLLDKNFEKEFEDFLTYHALLISPEINQSVENSRHFLRPIIMQFAHHVHSLKKTANVSFEKKVGKLFFAIPFIGPPMISLFRKRKSAVALSKLVRTDDEKKQLAIIHELISKYFKKNSFSTP